MSIVGALLIFGFIFCVARVVAHQIHIRRERTNREDS